MSDKAPAFQFYPKDYVMDEHVQLMSLEQEGAYLRLLCHSWLQGSIPADVPALAKICRVPPAKMARLWSGVKPCWKDSGEGRLVNGRQERDRAKQAARREVDSEKGKEGAKARWHRHSPGHVSAKARAMPGDSSPSAVSVLRTPVERTDERSDSPPSGRNPFVTDRPSLEAESLKLTREIAALTGEDGAEIFTRAAHYEGALRQKCNPATMREDRLLLTVQDLRATLKAEQDKRAKASA